MKIVFSLLLVLSASYALSQCPDPSKFCIEAEGNEWSYNSQSKSAAFEKGEQYTMSFIAYKNIAYNIGVCTMLLEQQDVEFEVYVLETKKDESTGRYEKVKKYLFRNSENELKQSCLIAGDRTSKVYVKLRVPNGETKDKDNELEELVCVGVLIEQAKNIRTGF